MKISIEKNHINGVYSLYACQKGYLKCYLTSRATFEEAKELAEVLIKEGLTTRILTLGE